MSGHEHDALQYFAECDEEALAMDASDAVFRHDFAHDPAGWVRRLLDLPDGASRRSEILAIVRRPGSCGMPGTGKQRSRDEYNVLARAHLEAHPTSTARELATAIGCALGTVPRLPAWKAVHSERSKGRKPKQARTIGLTPRVESAIGIDDDPLQKLVDEQEADAEPSPLEDVPSGRGRVRIRQRRSP